MNNFPKQKKGPPERLTRLEKLRKVRARKKIQPGKVRALLDKSAEREEESGIMAEKYLNLSLEVMSGERVEMGEIQQEILKTTIKEALDSLNNEENKEGLRIQIFSIIFDRKNFRRNLKKWKEEYKVLAEANPNLKMSNYVFEKAKKYIKECRDLVIEGRVEKTVETIDEEVDEAKKKEIQKNVAAFVSKIEKDLLNYYSLEDKEKESLLADFLKVFSDQGYDLEDEKIKNQLSALFDDIVLDVDATQLYQLQYETAHETMIKFAEDPNITDDEWEKLIQGSINKAIAKEEKYQYLEKVSLPPLFFGRGAAEGRSYDSIDAVAHGSGVHFEKAAGKGANVFYVRFPLLKDKSFNPLMKVVFDPPESRDLNNAIFVIEEEWADTAAPKGTVIESISTREYKVEELLAGLNAMKLDYVLNQGIKNTKMAISKEDVNEIITDEMMTHLAERLFGFKLKEKPLTKGKLDLYINLLRVILKDDKKKSLYDRVRTIRLAMDTDKLVPYIEKFLQPGEAVGMTVDQIIEKAEKDMAGEK